MRWPVGCTRALHKHQSKEGEALGIAKQTRHFAWQRNDGRKPAADDGVCSQSREQESESAERARCSSGRKTKGDPLLRRICLVVTRLFGCGRDENGAVMHFKAAGEAGYPCEAKAIKTRLLRLKVRADSRQPAFFDWHMVGTLSVLSALAKFCCLMGFW